MEILKVENLSFSYQEETKKALDEVSFSAERGEIITVCGATGSGKSTLLRLLKPELAPLGERSGRVFYDNEDCAGLEQKRSAGEIGYVMQYCEHQLVTDKVWHELAFGLENLGLDKTAIRRRVAETASYFGIDDWFDKRVAELSGGQKQLLNLASVMVMQPRVLILDEPTAQLDPIAAAEFINNLVRLNRELLLTIIIAEHRLEDILPISNKLLLLEKGRVLCYDSVRASVKSLLSAEEKNNEQHTELLQLMPSAVRLAAHFHLKGEYPLSIAEGRSYIEKNFGNTVTEPSCSQKTQNGEPVLLFKNVYFRYSRELPDTLKDLSFDVKRGEVFCILGGNGSGKTTMLSVAAGLNRCYSGEVQLFGRKIKSFSTKELYNGCVSLLPQDVQTVFLKNTVGGELLDSGIKESDSIDNPLLKRLYLLKDRHPYDLSGGEQQLLALAKVLAKKPQLLLMDEPTKGIDITAKEKIAELIKALRAEGVTTVIVTHDIDFAAGLADRCAFFFKGGLVSCDYTKDFFNGNGFYTTTADRMSRGYYNRVTDLKELISLCEANKIEQQ